MTSDIGSQREWLELLEAELGRRIARTQWEAGEGDRAREAFIQRLREIASRFAATAHRFPLTVDDMSIVEMLACSWFLPKHLQPAGLPSEATIWAQLRARLKAGSGDR